MGSISHAMGHLPWTEVGCALLLACFCTVSDGVTLVEDGTPYQDGAMELAKTEIPVLEAAAKKRSVAEQANEDKARKHALARLKMAEAKEAKGLEVVAARAAVAKEQKERAAGDHAERALKVELKRIEAHKKKKVQTRKNSFKAMLAESRDVKKKKSNAESAALKKELANIKKHKASALAKVKLSVTENVEAMAAAKERGAEVQKMRNQKKKSGELALKKDLEHIEKRKATAKRKSGKALWKEMVSMRLDDKYHGKKGQLPAGVLSEILLQELEDA